MTNQNFKILNTPPAQELFEKYRDCSDVDLENLMFKVGKAERELVRVVVTQLKLRRKAGVKFSRAERMLFTADGLEQATDERIAKYIASRFGEDKRIIDLTCSLGGNAIFLAQHNQVVAIDWNEAHIYCARENAKVYGVAQNIDFVCGDAFENIKEGTDAFFADPERARDGRTKTRSIFNGGPNLLELLPKMLAVTANVGIKISPAFDYDEIAKLPEMPEIEVISEDNVCKVAMLWFGRLKTCARRATCFVGDEVFSFVDDDESRKKVLFADKPLTYIYEPNKAIIKAHLVEEIAGRFSLSKLDQHIAYLTGNEPLSDEKILRTLKVLEFGEFSLKKIQALLKNKNILRVNIITRRFPVEITELYKKLKIKEGGEVFLIFTTLKNNQRYFILTERER